MYTIGTSALVRITQRNPEVGTQLVGKLLAFVGTPADMSLEAAEPVGINSYTVFFRVPAASNDPHKIEQPPSKIELFIPIKGDDGLWHWPNTGINIQDISTLYQDLLFISGYPQVLYSYPRGALADRVKIKGIDGLPFYAKDERALYVYDSSIVSTNPDDKWIKVASLTTNTVPVGGQIIWDPDIAVPAGWLMCDGATVNRVDYPDLYNVIGTEFGDGDGTLGSFNLPVRDSTIVKF